MTFSDVTHADEDLWSEDDEDASEEAPGGMDTMLSAPHFVEDEHQDVVHCLAPGQNNKPLSIFLDKDAEELAFVDIFCGQYRPANCERMVNMHYTDVVKSELRRLDRRAAGNVDNIFYETKKVQMKHLIDKVQLALRKCQTHGINLTAATFKDKSNIQEFVHKDQGYTFMKSLRGSPPYFEQVSKELMCIIRTLGPATFSVHSLLLRQDGSICSISLPKQLMTRTSHMKMFKIWHDYSLRCLLNLLKSDLSPLGELHDYFLRVEFKHRGRYLTPLLFSSSSVSLSSLQHFNKT